MKKLLSLILACCLTLCCAAALAETLTPTHTDPAELFATGDCTVYVNFDPETAFEEAGQMTFTVMEDDLYPADAVKALQPGDIVVAYGEEVTVENMEETEDGVLINHDDDGFYGYAFYYTDDARDTMYTSDTDIPSRTDMGVYTLPMAEQVQVSVWMEAVDGIPEQDMDTQILAAADVKAVFTARNDIEQSDYVNCAGTHVTVRVQDGVVTEIAADWGSDD